MASIRGGDLLLAVGGGLLLYTGLTDPKGNPRNLLATLLRGGKPAPPSASPSLGSSPASPGGAAGPPGGGASICASYYGGPTDNTGDHGYHGDNLNGTHAFAELEMGQALGGLPYKQKLRITYNGKSVIAEKLDIGLGGPGCGGYKRGIDLWWETASVLGFSGLGVVQYEVVK